MGLNMDQMQAELDRLKEREARRGKRAFSNNDIRWFKFQKGGKVNNVIRICPPGPDNNTEFIPDKKIAMPVYKHCDVPGVAGNNQFLCISQTFPSLGKECPICTAIYGLWDWFRSDGVDEELQKKILGKHRTYGRAYTNVIDRNCRDFIDIDNGSVVRVEKKEDREGKNLAPIIHVAGIPMSVYSWIVEQIMTREVTVEDGEESYGDYLYGDITDVQDGKDVVITVTGNGFDTKYITSFHPKSPPIEGPLFGEEARAHILKNLFNIGQIWQFPRGSKYDDIVGAGEKVRSLNGASTKAISDAVAESRGVPKEETSQNGTYVGTNEDIKPSCFGNHIESADGKSPFMKCKLSCAWEGECIDESAKLDTPVEQRRSVHGLD